MKKKLALIFLFLAIFISVENNNTSEAQLTVGFNLFFDALSPYGNWVSVPTYGNVWYPTTVRADWRPYTDGRWVWSDYGWTWVSYEPWGWAPFHYGRWIFLNYYGWVWIPGTVWAPAWVTWYTSPAYIGWAPLPPDNGFFQGINIGFNSNNYYLPPSYCVFVPSNYFLYPKINSVIVPRSQNMTIIKNTTNTNNITYVNNRVINKGPDLRFIEKATRVKIEKVNLVERDVDTHAAVKGGRNINRLEGRNLYVFRPEVVNEGDETVSLKREPTKSAVQIRNRDEMNYLNNKKVTEKRKRIPDQNKLENPSSQGYKKGNPFASDNTAGSQYSSIYPEERKEHSKGNTKKGELKESSQETQENEPIYWNDRKEINTKNVRLPKQDNFEKSSNQYRIKWHNEKVNSFAREDTTRFQNPDLYTEDHYPGNKNTGNQFSKVPTKGINNSRQIRRTNNVPYSQINQKPSYETKQETEEKRFQKGDVRQSLRSND